jgi:hypothetical protein
VSESRLLKLTTGSPALVRRPPLSESSPLPGGDQIWKHSHAATGLASWHWDRLGRARRGPAGERPGKAADWQPEHYACRGILGPKRAGSPLGGPQCQCLTRS